MLINPDIWARLEGYANWRKQEIESDLSRLTHVLESCESPLEQSFLLFHIASATHLTVGVTDNKHFLCSEVNNAHLWVHPQQVIEVASKCYRVDFLFILELRYPFGGKRVELIVEIDGHDYHERTKDQAQRDKSRDRLLTQAGYKIFRFTGSEVHRDISKVHAELIKYVQGQEELLMKEKGFL